MISSMTGYAAASDDKAGSALRCELRSVNSRFLDLQFKLADELRELEPQLREMLSARVARGKVECRVGRDATTAALQAVDEKGLMLLRELANQVAGTFPKLTPISIGDVLRWPGVVVRAAGNGKLHTEAVALCRRAVDELVEARGREGAKLATAVREKIAAMRRQVDAVTPLLPAAMQAYQDKITERLREAIGSADDERVRAEVALFAAKSDVDEELTRLRAHLDEMERSLAQGGAIGKRLDFIAQELNREANTLASKAASAKIADAALELKVLVEQIREQVQNIE